MRGRITYGEWGTTPPGRIGRGRNWGYGEVPWRWRPWAGRGHWFRFHKALGNLLVNGSGIHRPQDKEHSATIGFQYGGLALPRKHVGNLTFQVRHNRFGWRASIHLDAGPYDRNVERRHQFRFELVRRS